MKNYSLVVSDLDGTLLDDEKNLSPENSAAIREMSDRGVSFVASSGRAFNEMPEAVMNNPNIKYVTCSDGAVIYEKETKKPLITEYMPKSVMKRCAEIFRDYEIVTLLHMNGLLILSNGSHSHENYLYHNVPKSFEVVINCKAHFVDDCLTEAESSDKTEMLCVFFHSQKELSECTARLLSLGEVSVAASDINNIEIYYKKAGKGNALRSLAEMLGIDISDTIAVGDSKNDIEMVKAAGLGLAMKNSMPELLEAADEVICSNLEHCAKYILENYIK